MASWSRSPDLFGQIWSVLALVSSAARLRREVWYVEELVAGISINKAASVRGESPEFPSYSRRTVEKMKQLCKLLWRKEMGCIVISTSSSVSMLGFFLLLLCLSCFRGGRRKELEEWLGLWRQISAFLLFLELCSCGCACCGRRPDGRCWIGALLPPMRHLAVCKIPAFALGGYCGDLNEVYSSKDPRRRLSYCTSSSPVACRRRCRQWRIALCRDALEDLVAIFILVRVLFVIWGQLPRIWMYSVCILICV